ncbi:unnamed protein product [Cryptosporidium hominis]|uniref:KNTC1 third ARM-repeats domain-containing protein n=1 Tax=Cryptosporidium hominis TaxID=237895 RepID=A0A0S4TDR4_CRYHO|nr:hypothetical protein ChTU502y2012_401g0200 [Cryptosporidium hominis]PPA65166.1 hypothetical protein ChUKH1_15770 [Cryptosporidium hominis]CUV05225.1 unnamed protein product [Cryptosporidium hominis]
MYLKKVIELGSLPGLNLQKYTNSIRKVTIFNERLSIIVENLVFFFIITKDHKNAKLIYSWKINSEEELILNGIWIDNNSFIILSSSSVYLLALENESVLEVKTVKHGLTKTIENSEIILIDNFSNIPIDRQRIIAIVNFSSGFFPVSIDRFNSGYSIEIGNIITTENKGATPCENGIFVVNSSFIQKFYIDSNTIKCTMIDSLSIGEILNISLEKCDFKLISFYKAVKGNIVNVIFLNIEDGIPFNGIEIAISSDNLIPLRANKINIKDPDNIINISQTKFLDDVLANIIVYNSSVVVFRGHEISSEICIANYNDLNTSFIPFVSHGLCETTIFYAGCTLEEKTGNILINILEEEPNYNLIKEKRIPKFENYHVKDEQIILNSDEPLNNQFDRALKFNMVIPQFTKLISNLEKVDWNDLFEYLEKIPLYNVEDALNLLSSLVSALENSNSSNSHIMKMNYIIQKSITFDIIYKNNHKNFEAALKICSEYDSSPNEIDTNWDILLKRFLKCDLGKLCNCLLSFNLVEEFFFLFNRHFIHFGDGDEEVRSEIILESLSNLPVNLPEKIEKEIPSWLVNQVFPFVTKKNKLLNLIADRAITLEHVSNGDIDRCLFLLSSVFLNEYSYSNNHVLPKQIVSNGILWAGSGDKRYSINKIPLNKINQVYWAFLECNDLKDRYKLEINFSSLYYKKISNRDIAFKLLSRISSSELLNYEINHHVIPFCKLRGLEADQIIMEYLLELISSINYNSLESNLNSTNGRKYYQPRIISLINSITNDEYKAHALLQYLSLNNKCLAIDRNINLKFPHSAQNEIDFLMSYAKNISVNGKKSFELKNRIALIDAQNLLSRYNLDSMASIILFEKNAPRRLILHVISQVDAGIESFNDAMFLIDYLKQETNTTFMGISEAYCLRLRFLIFRRRNIIEWEKMTKKSMTEIHNKTIEEEILDIFSNLDCKKIYSITQQFVCFVWQFLDCYSINCNKSNRLKIRCEIATYSAVVVLRELFKTIQENKWKLRQNTFWTSNESFNTLIRLQQLQFEFGIYIRPSDIMIDKMDHDKNCLIGKEIQDKMTYLEPIQNKNTLSNPFGKIEADLCNKQIIDESFISEWRNGYFQLYKESCYKKLCEIFDEFAQPYFEKKISDEKKKGIFTKLLRLGSLIGVDESYIRRTNIRNSLRDGGKLCIFRRLTQELFKTPSSKNAIIIVDEVQNIILNLLTVDLVDKKKNYAAKFDKESRIDGLELIFIFSKLLQVVATCIPYCPIKLISFVLALSSDILWVHDFLLYASDSIDNIENPNNKLIKNHLDNHLFSKIIMKSLKNLHFLPLDSYKSYYKEICTLYPFTDAKQIVMAFLYTKIRIFKELSKQISIKKMYISPFLIYNFWTDPTLWTIQTNENYPIDVGKYIQELRENVDVLAKQLYQSECLTLAMSIYLKHPLLISDVKLALNINTEFFRKVLKGRDPIDGQLCMALSSSLEKKDSWNVFVQSLNPSNILDNYYRTQRMARIGWDLGILFNHYSMRKEMEDLHKQSKWCNSFRQLKIEFDQSLFFQKQDPQNNNQGYKKSIICKLIHNSDFDLILCLQYAKDYNINDEYILFLWSKQMILYNFDPKFELIMQNILSFVTPELGKEIFESTFELISSFDYERLKFVLNWYNKNCINTIELPNSMNDYLRTEANNEYSTSSSSSEINKGFFENQNHTNISTISKLEVLKILSTYKRVCPADKDEKLFIKNEAERINGNIELDKKVNFKVESHKYRIPFHYLIKHPINALKYEINDETIYKIKKMSEYLGIKNISIDIQFVWNIVLCRKYKYLSENNLSKTESNEFQEYCFKLVESDKILLRYIESIASIDLEAGIAIVLLVVDELPLSKTKIKLIEWCERKSGSIARVELKKGYPIINMEFLLYNRFNEVIINIENYLKSKKSLISSKLILKKHKLDIIFSKLIEETNDISIFISSLYYYLTPLISEGIYWKFKNKLQESVCQSFCIDPKPERGIYSFSRKNSIEKSPSSSNFTLKENFNFFIDEISSVYSSDIRKIRVRIIKNLLSKPFETPYEALKNKFPTTIKDIFKDIESSGIITGFDHWYKIQLLNSKAYDCTYIDRISFICGGISLNDAIILLLSISFKNSSNYSYSTKCNALKTLFQIASIKNIQKRYPKYDDLQVIWLHNYYMIYFNELHIPQDFSKFYLSEKVGLARSLWREFNNRRDSYKSLKSNQTHLDQIEDTKDAEFLKDENRKRKVRCIVGKENEYSNALYLSSNTRCQSVDKKLNHILYLITKLCLDFGIYDSNLFSNTIKNLYLQLFDENDVKIFSNLIFATYVSGYIYKVKINQSIIDVWNLLVLDPIFLLKNTVEYISNLINKYAQNGKDKKECVYNNNLLYNLPNKRFIIPILSKIFNTCPVIPFIEVFELLNAIIELINSILNLKKLIESLNFFSKENDRRLINNILSFFINLIKDISENNKINSLEKRCKLSSIMRDKNFDIYEVNSIFDVVIIELLFSYVNPVDLHYALFSMSREKIIKVIIDKKDSFNILPYLIYSTNSNILVSALSNELIKTNNSKLFFEIGAQLDELIDFKKKSQVEEIYLIESIKATQVYEFIVNKYKNIYSTESVRIIRRCIEFYKIEAIIPLIIKFLSGQVKSESAIVEQISLLENRANKHELSKKEIYNYIKEVIIKLSKKYKSTNIVQELIDQLKS